MEQTLQTYDLSTFFGLLAILAGVIGFFLRTLHKDLKDVIEDTGKLKGKMSTMEKEIEANRELQQMQLTVIKESLEEIKDDFKAVLSRVQKTDEIIIAIHQKMFNNNKNE